MANQWHGALSVPHEFPPVPRNGGSLFIRDLFHALPRRASLSLQSAGVAVAACAAASMASGVALAASSSQRQSQGQSGPTPGTASAFRATGPSQAPPVDEFSSTRSRASGTAGPREDAPLYAVTGGTGFLGEHLVEQLVEGGNRVRILARSQPKGGGAAADDAVEVVCGDISDEAALDALMQPPGQAPAVAGVFHLAGMVEHSLRRAQEVERVNVDGTLKVLAAAKRAGIKRVVYASTSGTVAVSADGSFVGTDESPYAEAVTRGWPYYSSKVEAEKRARQWAQDQGLELICMRPTLLLGPGDKRLSSCRSVADLLARKIPLLPSGGLSFVDVRDTAAAFVAAMEKGAPGATYLLGATNMTLRDFFGLVERLSGTPTPRLGLPFPVARGFAAAANAALGLFGKWDPTLDPVLVEMSNHYWYLAPTRAKEDLGFTPRDSEQTVADTIAWLRQHFSYLRS